LSSSWAIHFIMQWRHDEDEAEGSQAEAKGIIK